jgi:hypothetical protein
MNGNEHFQYALDALGDRRNSPEAAATLALAYEQRTANLIAYEAGLAQAFKDNALNENGVRLWKLTADQVHERLDLA